MRRCAERIADSEDWLDDTHAHSTMSCVVLQKREINVPADPLAQLRFTALPLHIWWQNERHKIGPKQVRVSNNQSMNDSAQQMA